MSHTLLIWEEIPERTSLFLLPNSDLDDEARRVLRIANGHYINHVSAGAEDELLCISAALCEKVEYLPEEHPEGSTWGMRWTKHRQAEDLPIEGNDISCVYRCGFLL